MPTVIREGEIARSAGGTLAFEDEPHGGVVSFFHVNNVPGAGPGLHRHPYSETWFIRSGRAHFVAGEAEFEASSGDVIVLEPNTPHKFTNIGTERLDIVCIHASPRFIQEDLE